MVDCPHCKELKCPRCKSVNLKKGQKTIKPDGTEYFEVTCSDCDNQFADFKIPYAALLEQGMNYPENLVHALVEAGLDVDQALTSTIKATPETIPYLIETIKDDACWEKTNGWAPINAMHLLSAMNATEALPYIIDILKKDPDRFGEWLTEHVSSFLFHLGKGNIDLLIELFKDKNVDTYARNAASRTLSALAHHNHELKPQIVKAFKEFFHNALNNTEDNELIAFCVEEAASLQDEELFGMVKQAFVQGMVSPEITELEFSEKAFRTGLPHALDKDTEDPMKHFDRENINHLLSINYPHKPQRKKTGRNEPCPCGSEKKYKKCCLQ